MCMWYASFSPLFSSHFLSLSLSSSFLLTLITVTNANRANADFMLAVLEVRQYFEFVVIGDECEFGKPHPAPYLFLLFSSLILGSLSHPPSLPLSPLFFDSERYLKGLELAGVSAEECIVFEVTCIPSLLPSSPYLLFIFLFSLFVFIIKNRIHHQESNRRWEQRSQR